MDESTKVIEKGQAEAIRAKREWEIFNRKIGIGGHSDATFLEAALSYLQNGGEGRFAKPIIEHFRKAKLSEIGQLEVEACARKLYPGLASSSINRLVFTPVSAIITHAAPKRKLCDLPSFERPKQPRGRVRWISHDDADRLISACSFHLKPIVTFLFFTGCRVGEALAIDWNGIELERGHAVFLETKNATHRRGIPLHPRVIAILANLPPPDLRRRVFDSTRGAPMKPRTMVGDKIIAGIRRACRRAGISDFHPHDCRHTWATWYYQETRDIAALMRLGGWRSVAMVLALCSHKRG